ncbi:zinc finger protein ZAT12-like [Zingiber officinale]|uniref:C2H2-type domain-containing protein n=1 Tax=Zingiber officinale TaxID=94328 RepID=A0A8J5KWJ8_ZINOF|nr:zinc finger protein ZAT12-like [Zingiber officinale]KAG6492289.1 hypothetical protein ZIOFF_047243 [Zingiber officinale]
MKRSSYRFGGEAKVDSINMANILMLLSRGGGVGGGGGGGGGGGDESRVFECKTCNRHFPSFQALGGHRASHKKPRMVSGDNSGGYVAAKPRIHECSVCGLEFAVGQALGGHMRRHRASSSQAQGSTTLFSRGPAPAEPAREVAVAEQEARKVVLDLNFPPLENDVDLKLGLGLNLESADN